jgi:Outer membrane protein beta-barrel domain
MKKYYSLKINTRLLFFMLLFFASNNTFGQSSYIGFSGGISFSKFLTGKVLQDKGLAKPIFNIFYDKDLNKYIGVRIGAGYYNAGNFESTVDINKLPIELVWNYKYISIPANIKFSIGNKFKPYVKVGAYLSYLLASKGLPFQAIKDVSNLQYINLANETKTLDFGTYFGFGLDAKVGKRYSIFSEVNTIYGATPFDKYSTVKQHYVSVEIGIKFKLIKQKIKQK